MVKKIRCICEICTCGRHHCIHRPKQNQLIRPRCLVTEYKDTYKQFDTTRVKPIIPESTARVSNQPFDDTTMYKTTFVPLKHEKSIKKQPREYRKPEGAIDFMSSYTRDYDEKQTGRAKSARPEYKPVGSEKPFDDTTVHNETYKQWEIQAIKSVPPPKGALRTAGAKFDHKTTFQNDYPGFYGAASRKLIKPNSNSLNLGTGDFVGETTTRMDYTHKIAAPEKSAKPLAKYIVRTDGFNHRTTTQTAFGWPENFDPTASCKPHQTATGPKEAFQGDTTHNANYKEWKIEPTLSRKPRQSWQPSTAKVEYKTTFQHDYPGKQGFPAKSLKPEPMRQFYEDAFEDSTTHNLTYRPWSAIQRELKKPGYKYERPKTRFDGCSTFQADFKGQQGKRPDLCIPVRNSMVTDGVTEFSTSYHTSYDREALPPCPARFLQGTHSGTRDFVFAHDQRGHQFFRKPSYLDNDRIEIQSVEG